MERKTKQRRKRRVATGVRQFRLYIEPLENRLMLASDFGDAPEFYRTTLAEGGASHVAIGPMLGATRDTETDGTHSANADHDDTNRDSDEDGVTFGTIRVGELDAAATVNVYGGPARLDAWIDFNRDGSWGGAWEQIADKLLVQTGDNTIPFDVPSWAASGTTFARFRLSTDGNLGIGGEAVDGEVEDYAIPVLAPNRTSSLLGPTNTIATSAHGAIAVFTADVDDDGDPDVLSASFQDNTIAWYENDGAEGFTPHTVTVTAESASSVFAADIDGDRDIDIASASSFDGKIAWYENDDTQHFVERVVTTNAIGADSIVVLDFDLDGDADLLFSSRADFRPGVGSAIAWFENDGQDEFILHPIVSARVIATPATAMDIDSDGDLDVFAYLLGEDGSEIVWLENDGTQTFQKHFIAEATRSIVSSLYSIDLDRDSDADLVVTFPGDDTVIWFEAGGDESFIGHTISTIVDSPYGVFAADIDGDGDVDVLTASARDDTVALHENDGQQRFTKRVVASDAEFAKSVIAADLDSDGDLDILSASTGDHTIAWYESNSLPTVENFQAATDEDTPITIELPYSDLDGDKLSIQIITADIQGIATIVVDGSSRTLSYDPSGADVLQGLEGGESVDETITLSIDDGNGGVETAEIVITVHGITDWQNPLEPLDANGDGEISPVDALVIVNSLNAAGARPLPSVLADLEIWYDVNGDGFISPLDVLLIINRLNASQSAGEAELSGTNEFIFAFPESSQLPVHRVTPARLRLPRAPSNDSQPHSSVRDGYQGITHYHRVELPKLAPHLQALDEFLANLDCSCPISAQRGAG